MNRKILALAIPSILANITTPLLGLVDTAIVGHMGSAVYIGAIAVGGVMFNMLYWLFSFLRGAPRGSPHRPSEHTTAALPRWCYTARSQWP